MAFRMFDEVSKSTLLTTTLTKPLIGTYGMHNPYIGTEPPNLETQWSVSQDFIDLTGLNCYERFIPYGAFPYADDVTNPDHATIEAYLIDWLTIRFPSLDLGAPAATVEPILCLEFYHNTNMTTLPDADPAVNIEYLLGGHPDKYPPSTAGAGFGYEQVYLDSVITAQWLKDNFPHAVDADYPDGCHFRIFKMNNECNLVNSHWWKGTAQEAALMACVMAAGIKAVLPNAYCIFGLSNTISLDLDPNNAAFVADAVLSFANNPKMAAGIDGLDFHHYKYDTSEATRKRIDLIAADCVLYGFTPFLLETAGPRVPFSLAVDGSPPIIVSHFAELYNDLLLGTVTIQSVYDKIMLYIAEEEPDHLLLPENRTKLLAEAIQTDFYDRVIYPVSKGFMGVLWSSDAQLYDRDNPISSWLTTPGLRTAAEVALIINQLTEAMWWGVFLYEKYAADEGKVTLVGRAMKEFVDTL